MAKSEITPVGDRVLVQHAPEKEQVRGGVIIPDNAGERSQEAKVIALGRGARAKDGVVIPFQVKVGDTVLVAKFAGAEVRLGEQEFTLVCEDDILGVLV